MICFHFQVSQIAEIAGYSLQLPGDFGDSIHALMPHQDAASDFTWHEAAGVWDGLAILKRIIHLGISKQHPFRTQKRNI